ncbi:uncharacterized protein N7484_010255, partial [Penicillium longicatenatum]|uniref:uncharacterized protein n=1 Tax=Penicillium longicatenatum TaxID=1561947 RepID=UPI0025482A87
WTLVELDENLKLWDVHFRLTVRDPGILPREVDWGERFLWPKKDILDRLVPSNTLYKRVVDKVHLEVCIKKYYTRFRARDQWTRFDQYLKPRIAKFARGARLTPEREEKLIVGISLLLEERELLRELLFKREGVLAWSWEHIQRKIVTEMLQDRLKKGSIKRYHGPYRNPWFLVKKKAAGQYRIIIAAMKLNSVTIRDANMPLNADEFAEDFAGMQICLIVDLFSGYDQISLVEDC